MQCPNCGAFVSEGEMYCGECGTRVQAIPPMPPGIQALPQAAPRRGLGTGGKIAIVVVIVLLLGVGALIAFSVLGCGGCCLYFAQDAPLEIALDYPQTVKVGQTFTLRATLRNTATGVTPLRDIGLSDSLLAGVKVVSSNPAYQKQDHLPTGVTTYWYYLDIPAGEMATITLHMQAIQAGTYEGQFTAFSDPGSKTTQLRFTVTP